MLVGSSHFLCLNNFNILHYIPHYIQLPLDTVMMEISITDTNMLWVWVTTLRVQGWKGTHIS